MKAKINIELWDNSPVSALEQVGLTTKFLELCYKSGYEAFTEDLFKNSDGIEYTISVEIEDNTVQ